MTFSNDKTYPLAYCANVHPAATLEQLYRVLQEQTLAVQRHLDANSMGIGLWFSEAVVRDALQHDETQRLAEFLQQHQLVPFTLNAFPQLDFHQPVVKYQVYSPDWTSESRLNYTLHVIDLLDRILAPGLEGSVSTLPLGWGHWRRPKETFLSACAQHLLTVAEHLSQLEERTGRLIYLCLEPEPGCALTTIDDVCHFFRKYLFAEHDAADRIGRYVRVCHDICHSAVMFERQADAIQKYSEAGIAIGKVQVSSAVVAAMPTDAAVADRTSAALIRFCDRKYLHQTTVRFRNGQGFRCFDDLPHALQQASDLCDADWRIHFHVPIHLAELGELGTSRHDIVEFVEAISQLPDDRRPRHFEVETYAWSVLPTEWKAESLAAGIAAEMKWLSQWL